MAKIAVSVDNHFDVNKIDVDEAIARIAPYLQSHQAAVYVNAGDSFNDFTKTQAFYARLQATVGETLPVRYLAGNHDLIKHITYAEAQSAIDPLYLHEQSLQLPGSSTVIVGNNGWYDYSLAPDDLQGADFAQWKRAYWLDSAIDQPVSDAERMARVLETTEKALQQAGKRRVIYVTHFVPKAAFMLYAPEHPRWQMATAMMGSKHLGALLERYEVTAAVFGHLHTRHAPRTYHHTTYYHQPMGYGLRRLNEWTGTDWFAEWVKTLVWLEI